MASKYEEERKRDRAAEKNEWAASCAIYRSLTGRLTPSTAEVIEKMRRRYGKNDKSRP